MSDEINLVKSGRIEKKYERESRKGIQDTKNYFKVLRICLKTGLVALGSNDVVMNLSKDMKNETVTISITVNREDYESVLPDDMDDYDSQNTVPSSQNLEESAGVSAISKEQQENTDNDKVIESIDMNNDDPSLIEKKET